MRLAISPHQINLHCSLLLPDLTPPRLSMLGESPHHPACVHSSMSDPQRLWPLRLLAVWPSSTATPVAARGQRCRLGLHRPSQELLELLPSISDSCSYVAIQNKTSRQSQRKKAEDPSSIFKE
ncbi:hypothetical protein DAI22_11g111900 [Oryza sativa Japonica Group]|nr:hypothetical protein DAI22_11g111900 [Oryza sativa Japonica Group]